jgi:hypothetical protein
MPAHRGVLKTLAFACIVLSFLCSCVTPQAPGSFRVLPAVPTYLLRSPDSKDTPFPEVLSQYSDVGQSQGWLLHPNTELHIENAYYREGAPKLLPDRVPAEGRRARSSFAGGGFDG